MAPDQRTIDAVANAIDAALDTWDAEQSPAWTPALTDSPAVADAIIKLLPQFGYEVRAIRPDDADAAQLGSAGEESSASQLSRPAPGQRQSSDRPEARRQI